MTLHEVTNAIYNASLGHYINGEKFTKRELETTLYAWTRPETGSASYIFEVCLPDGRWFAQVTQFAPGEYDWWIPETREQETILTDKLFGRH